MLYIGNEISSKMILSSIEDSSDTDEEESARLKEAVLGNISLKLESRNTTPKTSDTSQASSKPSLREQDHFDAGYDEQELQTTPEFKAFLSKRLSDFIESNISTEYVDFVPFSSKELHGVKLLNDSNKFINIGSKEEPQKRASQKISQRRQNVDLSSCSDSEDERHRLAEAVVSYNFIAENALPLQIQSKSKISEATNLRHSSYSEDREYEFENNDKQIQGKDESLAEKNKKLHKIRKSNERDHYMGRAIANYDDPQNINIITKYSSHIEAVYCHNGDSCIAQNSRKKKRKKDGDSCMIENRKKKKREKDNRA